MNEMNETKFEPDFMAFWQYDRFPFLLSGPVREFKPGGFVTIMNYGNSAFKPKMLLPLSEGERLARDLKTLESEYQKAIDAVHVHFRGRLRDMIPTQELLP